MNRLVVYDPTWTTYWLKTNKQTFERMEFIWWSLCTLYSYACQVRGTERRLRSLLLCLSDVFRALINSLACWLDWLIVTVHLETRLDGERSVCLNLLNAHVLCLLTWNKEGIEFIKFKNRSIALNKWMANIVCWNQIERSWLVLIIQTGRRNDARPVNPFTVVMSAETVQ